MKLLHIFFLPLLALSCNRSEAKVIDKSEVAPNHCEYETTISNIISLAFGDSTVLKMIDLVESDSLLISHKNEIVVNSDILVREKNLIFIKSESTESVDDHVHFKGLKNLFLTVGLCGDCESTRLTIISLYFGVMVELHLEKDQCNWKIVKKSIYDT